MLIHSADAQQTRPIKVLGIAAGIGQTLFLDNLASPLVYKGTNAKFKIGYSRTSVKTTFRINFGGGGGTILPSHFGKRKFVAPAGDTSLSDYTLASDYVTVMLKAAYLYHLYPYSSKNIHFNVGCELKESARFAPAVADYPWLINRVDLLPVFEGQFDKDNYQIKVRASTAVVSLVSREVYYLFPKSSSDNNVASFFKQGTKIVSFNKQTDIETSASLLYRLSKRNAIGASASMQWFRYKTPKTLTVIDNDFLLQFQHRL